MNEVSLGLAVVKTGVLAMRRTAVGESVRLYGCLGGRIGKTTIFDS